MILPIQYEGFIVSGASRVYNFVVKDALGGTRHFTVKILSESFRLTPLKFQDGPAISFERLKQELDGRPSAKVHLGIGDQDIQEYLARHYPRRRA